MELQVKRKKNYRALFLTTVKLLLFLLASNFFAFSALAQAPSPVYKVKLLNAVYESKLKSVGYNLRQRFSQTTDPDFSNIYTFNSGYSLDFLSAYLSGDYAYLEPEKYLAEAVVTVNDPGYTDDPQNIDKEWALAKAGFNKAWEQTTGSKNNIVAVIDTGIDSTHEDLRAINFVNGFDFVNNQPIVSGTDTDDNGHGTLVAGILGGAADNGVGIIGTNWQISIMPIKALDSNGKGDATALAEALIWAADHGAQFINLSIGGIGFGHDTALADAVSYAFNKGAVIVAAGGNDVSTNGGSLDQNPVFPICDDNNFNMVIGVIATDQNDIKPAFSNYGRNCVDVAAPGKRILSTINFDPVTKKSTPNSYAYASGTSLAVPFVVGQAALIKALYPFATNRQIRDQIISTADPIDDLNLSQCDGLSCQGQLGSGRIDVPKSLVQPISQTYSEGDLIKAQETGVVYEVIGGQKRLVSSFVQNQKFQNTPIKILSLTEISNLPDGPYVTPLDGTLVKFDISPTVYIMLNGQKLPVTYQVFQQRKLNFANVNTLSFAELDSWVTGNFLSPLDGTLLRTAKNKTVYWVVGQVLHAVDSAYFKKHGLYVFPLTTVQDSDINGFAKGEAYIG